MLKKLNARIGLFRAPSPSKIGVLFVDSTSLSSAVSAFVKKANAISGVGQGIAVDTRDGG